MTTRRLLCLSPVALAAVLLAGAPAHAQGVAELAGDEISEHAILAASFKGAA